jgi:hypothetical protein
MNLSNLSFLALQMGHISGGLSRAHKYPYTLRLKIGKGRKLGEFVSGGNFI